MLRRLRSSLASSHVLALAATLLAFLLYLLTLAPSITWQHQGADSGEFAAAVAVLGVPHPPGFPTYVLLGKAFQFLLPLGDVAFRLNVMSATLGALTVGLTFLVTRSLVLLVAPMTGPSQREAVRSGAAFLAAAALASGPLLWSQAVLAEVYTLNAFLFALVLHLVLRWWQGRHGERAVGPLGKALPAAAFLLGLGLGNHPTLAVLLPLGVPALLLTKLLRRQDWAWLGLAMGAGLLVYLYLPLAALGNPPVNWGKPSSLSGFLWTVSGAPYRGYFLGSALGQVPDRLPAWGDLLFQQYNLLGVLVGVLGVWHLWERARGFLIVTAGFILLLGGYSLLYISRDSFLYLIPAALVFSLWIGVGVFWLLSLPGLERAVLRPFPLISAQALLLLGLVVFVPLLTLGLNFRGVDLSEDREATQYAEQVVEAVPSGSLLLATSDQHVFSLWYKVYALGEGNGMIPVASPMLDFDWYWELVQDVHPAAVPPLGGIAEPRLVSFIRHNLPSRSVYLTHEDATVAQEFHLVRQGDLWEVQPKAVGSP